MSLSGPGTPWAPSVLKTASAPRCALEGEVFHSKSSRDPLVGHLSHLTELHSYRSGPSNMECPSGSVSRRVVTCRAVSLLTRASVTYCDGHCPHYTPAQAPGLAPCRHGMRTARTARLVCFRRVLSENSSHKMPRSCTSKVWWEVA